MEESTCPFCDQRLVEVGNSMKVAESCCGKKDMINNNTFDLINVEFTLCNINY